MQKKYYSKSTSSKETKKNGSAASSVARNAKSSYDDKPDDIGEIPWLIAKSATEGWSNEKFQTEFKRAQSSINVPRTRQYTDAARDDLVSWLSPDKYSDLEAKASNTYIPAQFGQRMLDNERMREYAERYQNTYIPATLAQDAIHRSGTGNDFNALADNALRSEFLRKLDTKSMQDELDALNNDLDSNKQQYNRTKAQYASYGNNTSDNGARAAKRYIDDYEAKQKRAAELRRDISEAESIKRYEKYDTLSQRDDFAEKSAAAGSKRIEFSVFDPSTWRTGDDRYDFINDIDGYRNNHFAGLETDKAKVMGVERDLSEYGALSHMTNDEIATYNYLYATDGKEAADEYIAFIQDALNYRAGIKDAENVGDNALKAMSYGFQTGIEQFGTGIAYAFSAGERPATASEYGAQAVRENLSDAGFKLPESIGGASIGQVAFDFAHTTGNMAPSILLSTLTAGMGASAALAQGVGSASMGLSAGGAAKMQAMREGYTNEQATSYGMLVGASEGALQYLLGGVSKLGGKLTNSGIQTAIQNIDNALLRVAVSGAIKMAGEGTEEYLQEILEPIYRNMLFGENNEIDLTNPEAVYSFLLGALTAGLLEGGSDIYGGINGSRNGNAILSSGKYAALLDSAIALGEKSEAAKIAQELRDGKIHANSSNVGELLSAYLNEGGDITSIIPSEQNTAEAQSAEEILRNGARAVAERETARMNANTAENVVQQNTAQIQPVKLDNANSVSNTNGTRKTAETRVATSDMATQRTIEPRSASEAASSLRSAIERSTDSVSGLDVYSDEDGSVTVSRNGSVLAEMNAREASAMASSYDSETNAIDYIGGFHAAYQLASEGMTINQITDTSILASDLTRAQLQAAYDSGRNASIESKRAAALDPKASGFKAGVNRIDQSTNLSRKQRSQIRILDAIGKKYGVEIIVDDGVHYSDNGTMMSRSDANGFYNPSTGRIHINLNAVGEAYLAVGMHELVHHVKNFNESGYNTLESVVLGALEERGENVDALVKYQMEHFGYSESQAREEVVANSIPAILNDEAYVRKLVETDRTLAERIRDFLSDFVEFINETLRALEGEASWKQMRSLREDMDMLSTIAELFDTALKGAGETVDSNGYVRPSDASSTSDIINDTADGIIEMPKLKWSAKTLNEKQLKDSLSQRQAQILGIPYSIEKVGRNGKTGVFATTMDVTEAVMKKNGYSASDVKTVRGFMKRVSDYLTKQAANEYRFVGLDDINSAKIYIDRSTGKVLLSCRVKNGEYDVNFDFTKVCKKREAMQRFIDDLARSEGRNGGATMLDEINLSPENIFKMNTILKDAGYETACLGCFVEAKRYNIRSWAETIVSEWNDLVLQRNPNAVYFGFATGDTNVDKMSDAEISKLDEQLRKYNTDGTSSATERMPRLMDTSDGMLKLLRVSDLITTQGRTALHEFSSELESIVASRYGTASPKSVEAFTPYNSEIALLPDSKTVNGELMSMADYLLKIAGVRSQSFSDFIITHVLDHLQKTVDLAARRFTAHTYTKEISRAVLFGMSGEKINLSVMFDIDGNVRWEYAGLDADGNYIVGDSARASLIERITGKRPFTQSIDFNAAVELEHDPQYSKNCGIIGVGYSYNHILKMLRDNNIPYIIAYHRSGLPTVVATASNVGMATDYTSVQNTLQFKSGAQFSEVHAESDIPSYATWNASKKAKRSKLTFDLKAELAKTGDPQKAMKNFLSFMEENNLTPNVKKKVAGHGSFDLYGTLERTGSPKATADAYISWCIENGSIPMLYEFAAEDNYWKFLFDFSVIDLATGETAPQQPVSIDWLSEMGVDRFVEMVDKYMKQYNEYRSNQFGSETESSKYADTKEKVYNALKFSMKDPIEESGNLIAIHNLSCEQLTLTIDLGGFPMPSIAVMKSAQGHERYGDVSVLFDKDTIDPALSARNKVYGGDAWTPSFPSLEYKVNEKKLSRISDTVNNLTGGSEALRQIDRSLSFYTDDITNKLNRNDGNPVTAFRNSEGLKYAYLRDIEPGYTAPTTITNNETIHTIDTNALREYMNQSIDQGAYEAWLARLFDGIVEKKGIRNKKSLYTSSGNRRGFSALHYEYTLENIVKAMRDENSKGVDAFVGNSLFGVVTKDYKSIDDIRSDKNRLKYIEESEYKAIKREYQSRFLEIANSIKDLTESNSFIATDNAAKALVDAARRGKTLSGIKRVLKEYTWLPIKDDTAKKLYDLMRDIMSMPTEYFEAKPERVVGLDEIRLVVLPKDASDGLKQRISDLGVPVREYDPKIEGDRTRVLNSDATNSLRFSLKDTSTVDVAAVERENRKLVKSLSLAEDQVKLTRGHRVKEGYIGVLADKALRDYSSSYDSATLKDNLIKIFKFLAKAQKPNMSEVNSLGVGLMKAVLEKSSEFDADGYNAYSDVRSYLRSTSITLSEDQRAEAAVLSDTYGKYRSSLFGSVKLTNDGLPLYTAWQELSSMNSALFPPETNASDMPRVLAVAAEAIKRGNFYTNPYGYDLDAFAADAWSNILESYFKSQTFADVKQSEIDALNQKMRDERNAARKDAKAAEREIMRNAEQYAKDIAKRDKREAALRDQILLERVKRKNRPDGKELTPMQIASLDVSNLSSTPKLAPIDASSERGGKSKFAESVDKSQNVSDEVRNLIQNEDDIKYYAKIANNETLNEANYRLNSLGEAETLRWYDARPENATALDVAEGFILLKRYQDAGDYESAVTVITKLRQMGSRAGQTVQAYSILGRLTPEAMSVYAQKELDTLRDEMVKRFGSEWVDKRAEMFQLTPEEAEKIKNTITEASKLPEGRDKNVLIASIASDIEAKLPTNSGKVIKALARNFMLLNSRTMIRNVAGNAIMMPAYVVQDFIGAGIDKALSKKTGIRTTGFSLPSKEGLKAAAKGLYESYDDFRRDINTKQIENDRFEIGNGHAFKKYSAEQQKAASTLKRQGMRLSNALNMMDRITGFLLDAGDRPFFEYHFTNSINAQIRLNNATEPTAEMIEIATSEALMRTWQDDNAMTRAASKLRNMLNPKEGKSEFGFGTLVVPFTKTPANLVKALVDYSPAGLVNALARKARAYSYAVSKGTVAATMQKDFVTSLSKGITGTLIMLLSAVLANAGLITGGDDDEDKDLSAFKKNILGIAPYSVVIDGHSYTYDWAQPIGGLMAISADLVNNINSGKSAVKGLNLDGETQEERSDFMKALGAGGNAILNALSAGGNVMFEQSFMSGIKNLFSENGVVDGIVNSLMSSTTQFIPTALGQIAQIADPYARASYESNNVLGTTGNKLKAKIPGMRNDLAPVVDVMGNDVLSNGGNNSAFNVFLNPSNTYSERTTEAALEIYRVYQETGVLSVVPRVAPYSLEYGETYKFTAHERAQYQRVAGQTNTEIVNQLLSSKSYAALSDDQRAAVLTDATQYANAIAKEDFLSSKGVTYDFGSLSWVVKARDAENVGLSAGDYMIARSASRGIEGIKDADGNTIKNSKGLQIMSAVYAIRGFDTLPEKQRLYLFESLGVGKDVRHWNKALVEQELAKMRR